MTDSTSWQPPAGATPPPAPSPYAGAPDAPQQPGWAPPPPAAGWTPPPKPGLIPLRPLTVGTILGASFQVLRRNPRPTFGFSLVVTGIIYVVTFGIVGIATFFAFSRLQFATSSEDAETLTAGSVGIVIVSAIVPVALSIVGSAILQGIISLEVARGTLGEKLRLPDLWRAAKGRLGALIGWSAIIAVGVTVAVTLIVVIIALIVALGGVAGIVVGVLLGLLFGAAGIAAAIWLGTKLALVPSVLMLERLPLRDAVRRSWSLTTGSFWRTFGILILVAVIIQVVQGIIATPLQVVASFASVLISPNGGDQTTGIVTALVVYIVTILFAVVFGAIGAVALAATPALLYIDLRMRTEGLDLELSRFVEARQAGDASVVDPYLLKAGPTAPPAATWP